MYCFLIDEFLYVQFQLIVFDQWQCFFEDFDEEFFVGWQQYMQNVENVGGYWFVGYIVKWQVCLVEFDILWFEDEMFVVGGV